MSSLIPNLINRRTLAINTNTRFTISGHSSGFMNLNIDSGVKIELHSKDVMMYGLQIFEGDITSDYNFGDIPYFTIKNTFAFKTLTQFKCRVSWNANCSEVFSDMPSKGEVSKMCCFYSANEGIITISDSKNLTIPYANYEEPNSELVFKGFPAKFQVKASVLNAIDTISCLDLNPNNEGENPAQSFRYSQNFSFIFRNFQTEYVSSSSYLFESEKSKNVIVSLVSKGKLLFKDIDNYVYTQGQVSRFDSKQTQSVSPILESIWNEQITRTKFAYATFEDINNNRCRYLRIISKKNIDQEIGIDRTPTDDNDYCVWVISGYEAEIKVDPVGGSGAKVIWEKRNIFSSYDPLDLTGADTKVARSVVIIFPKGAKGGVKVTAEGFNGVNATDTIIDLNQLPPRSVLNPYINSADVLALPILVTGFVYALVSTILGMYLICSPRWCPMCQCRKKKEEDEDDLGNDDYSDDDELLTTQEGE